MSAPFDAVVLAGGRASRLDGIDKTALGPAGDTLLDRALAAVSGARLTTVVAGDEQRRPVPGVRWTVESPRHGGPVAALVAALAPDPAPLTVVLAADLAAPERALPRLLAAGTDAPGIDGWIAVDPEGRDQPLLAVYRSAPLVAALRRQPQRGRDVPVRRLLAGLALVRVPLPADLVADVDTPADAARLGLLPGS